MRLRSLCNKVDQGRIFGMTSPARFPLFVSILLCAALAVPRALAAPTFPDVPADHIFYDSIEALVAAGVVNGNPDGTFDPNGRVNRAAMLKMLYKAMGKVPDPSNVRCFPDVIPLSWYEPFVCDAAANQYVNGYATGLFLPDNPIIRVEALKMIQEVMEFEIPEISDEVRSTVKFADTSISAWYTKYLFNAYVTGIMPIPGQDASLFHPEWEVSRGEAAAMIHQAMQAKLELARAEVEGAMADSDKSDEADEGVEAASPPPPAPPPPPPVSNPGIQDVSFPFEASGKFDERKTFTYRFSLSAPVTVHTEVELQSGQPGGVRCTLLLLNDNGFSDEYYIGYRSGDSCELITSLKAGNYQLQLQPTIASTTYSVSVETGSGDGNDGFVEAGSITRNTARSYSLIENNLQDWYTFSVGDEDGSRMMIEMTNSEKLDCIIYPMSDVDLYGFTGPECNQFYTFPKGTYFVGVTRSVPKTTKITYTIRLRE